jgi:deoxyribose-phosphate aldolase
MFIEYYITNIDEKEIELKNNIEQIIQYPISGIVASHPQSKFIKKNFPNIRTGCFVDYPIANNDIDRRPDLIKDAISIECNYINITIPFYYIINRKYNKFREDIKKNLDICNSHSIELRYILEYRKFDHQLLLKVCEILLENQINTIYPSTGLFLDNIEDNTIACAYLNNKTGINTIVNGNIWKKDQITQIHKIQPYGFSTNQIETVKLALIP